METPGDSGALDTSADSADIERHSHFYVVCPGCGFFYGNIALRPAFEVACSECGSEDRWVFSKVDRALEASAQVKDRNRAPKRPDASWGT